MREKCLTFFYLFFFIFTEIGCLLDNETETCYALHHPICNEEQLIQFLANIQVINPESIVELAVDSLDPLCRNLCKHLHHLDDYLRKCTPGSSEALYMSLIAGVKVLRDKLCTDSDFYRRFNFHYHCLHELKNDFEGCNAPADWNEETDKTQICKDYKSMLDCYYVKAAKVCGIGPANSIKELMRAVVDSVIKVKCSGLRRNPYVKDPMPAAYLRYDMSIDSNKAETAHTASKIKEAMFLVFLILYTNL